MKNSPLPIGFLLLNDAIIEVNSLNQENVDHPRPCLLLVDDSEDDAFFFMRALRKTRNECVVHRASNGAEAIDFLKRAAASAPPDLPVITFLDLKMPILNGFEVLEWLRDQPFGSALRVVVLSGSESQKDKDRAAELGATVYLVKPAKVSDLERLLGELCFPEQKMGAHA